MTSEVAPLRSPPGYAALRQPRGVAANAVELFIPATTTLLAFDQLLLVQPNLYLRTGTGPGETLVRAVLIGCAIAGWITAKRVSLVGAAYLASLCVACTGLAHFWAFFRGELAGWVAVLPSAIATFSLAVVARRFPHSLLVRFTSAGLSRVLLHPILGATLIGSLVVTAVLSNLVGTLRSGLFVAGGLAATGLLAVAAKEPIRTTNGTSAARCSLSRELPAKPKARGTRRFWCGTLGQPLCAQWAGYALLVTYALSAVAIEHTLPLHRVVTSSHPIAGFATSERCSLEVTAGQGAYHLFVDGELRISTFDERRWAEAMVRPALARVRQAKHALVLSTGEGLLERELLKDGGLESITSVSRCRLVPDVARRSAWLRGLTNDALNSSRVTVVERDPAVYAATADQRSFDVIIVDLPDPSGPVQSKYYSRYFYQQLAARMQPESILVVQATSARRSPRTFATIGATLRAAGLDLAPAMVPLISRGEWSLYFAAKQPLPPVVRPEWIAGTLAATTPEQFSNPWPDTRPPADFEAAPSTLYDAKVLDWFEREAEATTYPITSRNPHPGTPDGGGNG